VLAYGPDPRNDLHSLLCRRFDATGCALLASGTHALRLALESAVSGRDAAELALLPAYTCFEVATAAVGAGVRVALYDVDPVTLEPDWGSVRRAAAAGAAALVVAPLFGMPLDWDMARRVATELDAVLIEDAAQAHGSTRNGRPVGSFGDLSILSFGRGKGWTGGGGGALLWRGSLNPELVIDPRQAGRRELAEATAAARIAVQWLFGRPALYGIPASIPFLSLGETIYHEPTPPAPMTRAGAALLLAGDEVANVEVLWRRNSVGAYSSALSQAGISPSAAIGGRMDETSGSLRFPMRLPGGWSTRGNADMIRLGVAPGYPAGLHALPALRRQLADSAMPLPGAETLARELITLPTHSLVSQEDIARLAAIMAERAAQ
jgi:dTDP-4-amino-4,6-dideoxygalactose transaminase